MPKYKGKDVKVGSVIEVPLQYTVVAIGGGHITAASSGHPPATVTVVDEAPVDEDGKPFVPPVEKPLVIKLPKHAPAPVKA